MQYIAQKAIQARSINRLLAVHKFWFSSLHISAVGTGMMWKGGGCDLLQRFGPKPYFNHGGKLCPPRFFIFLRPCIAPTYYHMTGSGNMRRRNLGEFNWILKSAKINMKWGLAIKRYVVARLATTYLLIRNVCYVFIENELRTAYALTLIHQSTWLQANLYLRDNEKKILRSWKLVHLQYILSWIYLHLRSCSKQIDNLCVLWCPWRKFIYHETKGTCLHFLFAVHSVRILDKEKPLKSRFTCIG